MLSPARLLIVSGSGGAGTTTVAAATAWQTSKVLQSVLLIDADAESENAAGRRAAAQWFAGLAQTVLTAMPHPLLADEITVVPGVDDFLMWASVAEAVSSGSHDLVVVDAGPISQMLRSIRAVFSMALFAQAMITPEFVVAGAARGAGDTLPSVDELRAELDSVIAVLRDPATAVRLVSRADQAAVLPVARAIAVVQLLGICVDTVFVGKVPTKSSGWPKGLAKESRQFVKELARTVADIPVVPVCWISKSTAHGLREVELGDFVHLMRRPPQRATVEVHGVGYLWHIPLALADELEVSVGRADDRLVVDVDGWRVVMPLPSVIKRCIIEHVTAGPDGLAVHCAVNEHLWRSP